MFGAEQVLRCAIFVTGTEEEAAREHCRNVAVDLIKLPKSDLPDITDSIDYQAKVVRATLRNSLTRTAKFYGDQGCILHPEDHDGIYYDPVPVETNLPDADTQLWPMGDLLPDDPLPPEVDEQKLKAAVELAFDAPAQTSAMTVVYKGRLVAERYVRGVTKDTLLESWSMGKSLTGTRIPSLKVGHRNAHRSSVGSCWMAISGWKIWLRCRSGSSQAIRVKRSV